MSQTSRRFTPSERSTLLAASSPFEIDVPRLKPDDHGLVGYGGLKYDNNVARALAGAFGGSASYAVSEKSTSPKRPCVAIRSPR